MKYRISHEKINLGQYLKYTMVLNSSNCLEKIRGNSVKEGIRKRMLAGWEIRKYFGFSLHTDQGM